ncbi:MAG: FidL-like protein [Sodalis sp. (in: enterobacteria)]|uniref:FidL-like protein n=1 Tax=Sodalis sp. (in: enterobacteria) TaxID=1898979 RepID=UPI003F2F2F64
MKVKRLIFIALAVVVVAGGLLHALGADDDLFNRTPQIDCKAFTVNNLNDDNQRIRFSLNVRVRLFGKGQGILYYKGYANYNGSNSCFARTVYLSHAQRVAKDAYRYQLDDVVKSPLDQTQEAVFNEFWSENTADKNVLLLAM